VELSVKVVLIGRPFIYYLLHAYDKDFPNLFKVKADFDTRMDLQDDNLQSFVQFVATYCEKESLRHLDAEAVVVILEHATRMAEHKEKLSTKFGYASDIIREADFWAQEANAEVVAGEHVKRALDERVYRSNLLQERICELIDDGTILIDTEGSKTAQVNGLSILDTGEFSFGRPSRITATVAPGRKGIVDLEREADLGGPVHSKGVLILSGLLSARYAEGHPLSLSARIVFEQSYSGVDGDSASLAELFAIISALSDVPLAQGIAVTGSVNQRGEVQAVGGINEKIEGFFDICRAIGVEGGQGVVIPEANVRHLALREDVRNAVDDGGFSLWAIETVDEGLEILTGESADTVNEKVRKQLERYESTLHEIAGSIGRASGTDEDASDAAERV
jgi:lon-related putative ATP-dependent protease